MDKPNEMFAPLTKAELTEAARDTEPGDDNEARRLFSPPAGAEPGESAAAQLFGRKPDAAWRYETAEGVLAFLALRWNEGEGKKTIRPLSWAEGEGWRFAAWPGGRPLYNLPAIVKQTEAPIIVCEGEKAAEAAARIFPKSLVTTASGGAKAAAKSDWSPLARRRVLIWPDHDAAGLDYANEVAAILAGLEADVSIIDAKALAALNPAGGAREPEAKWDAADAAEEWADRAALRKAAGRLAKPYEPGPRYISFHPYEMTSTGLMVEVEEGKGDNKKLAKYFVSGPFEIVGACRDADGAAWGKVLRWRDPDKRSHLRHVTNAALQGEPAALCAQLADLGLSINRSRQRFLLGYLNAARVHHRARLVSRTGWHTVGGSEVFVLPAQTIGPPMAETVILEAGANAPYEERGTFADWRDGVAALARGQTLPMLAISTALAGPLLYLAAVEGGGVHFFGQSSKGKTTILQMAASVWGRGATSGFMRGWRSTANALEGSAALATDTALILDEMGLLDPHEAAAAAYALANGGGKQRAARDGSLREPKSWRVVIVSSGEITFEAKIGEAKGRARAGQTIRLLDIPADRGLGFGVFDHAGGYDDAGALARAIKMAAGEAYGTAGPEFVRRLIRAGVSGADVRSMLADFVRAVCPAGADGQVERVAQRLGLFAAAGELAAGLDVLPWKTGETREAAAWAFGAWLENRGGAEPGEARQAIAAVRLFLEQYGDSRFDPAHDPDAKPTPNRAGWRRGEGEAREWLIPPETWKAEICQGLDPKLVARTLAARGHLHRIGDGFQAVLKIGGRNMRVYVIKASILAGGEYDA